MKQGNVIWKIEPLYAEMLQRVLDGCTRLRGHAADGCESGIANEGRAMLGQLGALVELLEIKLHKQGRFTGFRFAPTNKNFLETKKGN